MLRARRALQTMQLLNLQPASFMVSYGLSGLISSGKPDPDQSSLLPEQKLAVAEISCQCRSAVVCMH
jgi:hypothetical protein